MAMWYVSLATLGAANIVDLKSTRGLTEVNPVIGAGAGTGRQIAVKAGLFAGIGVVETLAVRKWPKTARVFTWINFGGAGVTAAAAAHNYRQ